MKDIREYISEALNESVFDKDLIKKNAINDCPSTKQDLVKSIAKYIEVVKPKRNSTLDLNWLDVSNVGDLASIFDARGNRDYETFNFDVSEWDVSNCKNFTGMFCNCKKFNCDLSSWDVSFATHMGYMFQGCKEFDGKGLDSWNVPKNCFITGMFKKTKITEDSLPKWADKWTLK